MMHPDIKQSYCYYPKVDSFPITAFPEVLFLLCSRYLLTLAILFIKEWHIICCIFLELHLKLWNVCKTSSCYHFMIYNSHKQLSPPQLLSPSNGSAQYLFLRHVYGASIIFTIESITLQP